MECWVLFFVILPATIIHADDSADGIVGECLGNRVQFTIPSSLRALRPLEIYAVNDTQTVLLTPNLAAQCGYNQKTDPLGNTIVSSSLQSCFTQNKDDVDFTVAMQFKLYDFATLSQKVYDAVKTCTYQRNSREILCETNFMEVSVRNAIPSLAQFSTFVSNLKLWKIIVFNPEEKVFDEDDLIKMGYNVNSSATRLVMRSPYNMPENFVQRVADVDMVMFNMVVLYRDRWMLTIVESSAACPTNGAAVVGEIITWHVPLHITPLISYDVELSEIHLGVNGKRLSTAEMASRNYTATFTDSHIVVTIPIGSPDGNYKSQVQAENYHISYTIEPMLEILWREGEDETKYKVLFPITTPLIPWPPQITDNTQPKEMMFDVLLGNFLPDVMLLNITVGSEVLGVSDLLARGFVLHEHSFPNGTKAFSFKVTFSDPNVKKTTLPLDVTRYTLPLVFGFVILPEHQSFLHSAVLEASLSETVVPKAGGTCEQDGFQINVEYGSTPQSQLKIILGERELNNRTVRQYKHSQNNTHFIISIPLMSPDVVFESVNLAGVMGRLDVKIKDSLNDWNVKDFSLSCSFFVPLIECLPNGTVTVILPKLESVPHLIPGELSLRDPTCKPHYSDDNFAYFYFAVNTCGTSRTFVEDAMKYGNEVTWKQDEPLQETSESLTRQKDYRFTLECIYRANASQSLMFHSVSPSEEPKAEVGAGELNVQLRLSQDMVYKLFYHDGDYPVVKFMQQPLYFEVGMDDSKDSRIAVVLDNCWATLNKERNSRPRWDLIVDGCANPKEPQQTTIVPVTTDERVQLPDHYKRFEVNTLKYHGSSDSNGNVSMARQVFVHCDVVICHVENADDGSCFQQCAAPRNSSAIRFSRVRRRSNFRGEILQHVSAGPILLM